MNNAPNLFPHNTPTTKEVNGKCFSNYYFLNFRLSIFARYSINIFQVKRLQRLYYLIFIF